MKSKEPHNSQGNCGLKRDGPAVRRDVGFSIRSGETPNGTDSSAGHGKGSCSKRQMHSSVASAEAHCQMCDRDEETDCPPQQVRGYERRELQELLPYQTITNAL